jgi:hypothetical protein
VNRLWVPIAVWLPESLLLGAFGSKKHRITVTEFVGLCRKQVEGEQLGIVGIAAVRRSGLRVAGKLLVRLQPIELEDVRSSTT